MKHRRPSKQERQSRMALTLTLSGCVFVVTLVTLLIIGATLLIVDRTGQLGKWMEHSSVLSFFLIIAAISLVGGTLMALLAEYARPRQDYFSGMTKNGCGWHLTADAWPEGGLTLVEPICCVHGQVPGSRA